MKSYVVKSDCNPIWRGYEEVWRWVPQNIGVMDDLFFELEVWDADIFTSDDIIGVAAVDIHTLASGPVHHDVELIGEVGEPCGRLLFDLEVIQVSTIKATFYEVKAIGLQAPPPETTLDPYVEYHFSGDGNAGNYAQSTVRS
jgi:Ca2+-dependent lipid-binding protein